MIDNHRDGRFERVENGALVFALYEKRPGLIVIRHVEAAPILRGTGAAARLMQDIAEMARTQNTALLPLCGYASAWLRRNAPELIAAR